MGMRKTMTIASLLLLVLVLITAVACGGLTRDQILTLAKAKVQEEGWRPLYADTSGGGVIIIIACPQQGEARGLVYALLLGNKGEIMAVDNIAGATCDLQAPPVPAETN